MSLDPVDPSIRASDADREQVATRLREAHAEGRLTVEEFGQRLDAVYAARTHGELTPLTRDLPAATAAARVAARTGDEAHPARRDRERAGNSGLRAAWAVWAAAVLVNLVVWGAVSLSSGDLIYFWPVWVAGPWGALLLARTIFQPRPDRP